MKNRKLYWYGLLIAAGISSLVVQAGEKITPVMRETLNRTDLSRQEIESRADAWVEKANKAYAEEKYEESRNAYLNAAGLFKRIPSGTFNRKLEYCKKQIVNVYIAEAQDAINTADRKANAHDFDEAIRLCREALKKSPEYASKLNERISYYEKRRNAAAFDSSVSSENLIPNLKTQTYQIELLLEQGRKLGGKGEYTRAVRKFQEVLLMDPYNADALQGLRAMYARISHNGVSRQKEAHMRSIAEVDWKYAAPITANKEADTTKNLLDAKSIKKTADVQPLKEKMAALKIPFDVDNVTLEAALDDLSTKCRNKGINIVLLMPAKQKSAPAKKADGAGEEGGEKKEKEEEEGEAEESSGNEKFITLSGGKNTSALEILEQICKQGQIQCIYEPYAIILRPRNVAVEAMETKLFAIAEASLEQSGSDPEALKNFFLQNGNDIEFPEGHKIFYDNKISRLIVTNTPDNLRKIGDVVSELIARPEPMIQIQAKFIEISQNDLDELAFNYQYAINKNKAYGTSTNGETRAVTTNESSNELLRYYRSDTNTSTDPLSNSNFSFLWANNDGTFLRASVYALNYADSTDTLSSPRVTTLPRKKAVVKMVEIHYYPDEWETVDYQNDSTSSSGSTVLNVWNIKGSPDPQPTFDTDEGEELGISFEITPDVDKEKRLITAPVKLPINSFSGWQSWDSRTTDSGGDSDGEYFKKAVIDNRTIETKITLYDGETVVLGGIAMDNTTKINDKIPILGDIPIIGRFFQSKYTKAEKRNILVFLTCRLVKPDGSAYYTSEKRSFGVADFGKDF